MKILGKSPKIDINVSLVPTIFLASSYFFAPMFILKFVAVPIPTICENAVVRVTTLIYEK
ncbi:hypothetical protein [Intestinibacter sp.]